MTAVVVNFNAGDLLANCVASLRAEAVERVIVVDNGSTDGSLTVLRKLEPDADVIQTGANLGYGKAANLGALGVRTDYLLVLNPDTVTAPGALAPLVAALAEDPRVGLVGPRLLNPDGSFYPTGRAFPTRTDAIGHALLSLIAPRNRFTARYKLLDWDRAGRREVDWISGACFLARRQAWEELGGFDEAFFMYMEDVDLCWRAWRAGWAVAFEPASEVTHIQGASTDRHPYRMIVAHHRSVFLFASRTLTGTKRSGLPIVALGLALRAVVACGHRWLAGRRGQ